MTWTEMTKQRLQEARRELEAAEQGLVSGTEAARARYTRAVREAEIAEQHASWVSFRELRQPSWA
jgi:hypothetical protein